MPERGASVGVEGEKPGDATLILFTLMQADEKLDQILSILQDDDEEADNRTDA